MSNPFDLTGRVAMITGATRGIGRSIADTLANAGAEVIVVSRKADACERTATELEQTGGRAIPLAANVNRWSECDELVQRAYAEAGRIDILVNNAGSSPRYDSVDAISEELFDKTVALNLKGPFRLTALVGTRMAASGGGAVVNISTISAQTGAAHAIVYAAAKAGMNNLTKSFAQALAPSVRVNAIMPGAVDTDVVKAWPQHERDLAASKAVLGRLGEPTEIAGAALYLASDAASFTTGQVFAVDGGLS
ncbi:glucose 1-dehydrogenase [Mycolicibacterium flavescens]|uniref:3-oxoacyl-[acyl-carrier-protein] reductase MabA n=1 Tax=Mycolicibacterium flavescens TaxID=1776 RepID=A0A1E3REN5_MYCFV|nr:glucose 1-dehydrogenase [Mycolicibacterium flavescens]MCV7282387.1 glucose 1-dehydrogenase [Mycolicibacterium flavescens]ODQ87912.1 short-chain dehydrogenase [Mycolicibacterium flavescens]